MNSKACLLLTVLTIVPGEAYGLVTSFTGTTDSTLLTNSSTQTKRGGLNVGGSVGIGISTDSGKLAVLGNVNIYGLLNANQFLVGGLLTGTTGIYNTVFTSRLFVDSITARSPPSPIRVDNPFFMQRASFTWSGSTISPQQTTIDGSTLTANFVFVRGGGAVAIGTTAPRALMHLTTGNVDTFMLKISSNNFDVFEIRTDSGNSRIPFTFTSATVNNFTAGPTTFTATASISKILWNDGTVQTSSPSSIAVTGNSTFTKTISYGGSIYISTIETCGFPGACWLTGPSTYYVASVWASFVKGSTVGMTSLQLVVSTGSINSLQFSTTYFPRIDIDTQTVSRKYNSAFISTGSSPSNPGTPVPIVINSGWCVGVQTSTIPISGQMPQTFTIGIDVWKKPYGAGN